MARDPRKAHFIKQWRQKRRLSLRKLADRMETEPGGKPIASHATIGRIEQGKQPYSPEILPALAEALDTTVEALLFVDPFKEGEVIDLLRLLDEGKRAEAINYLRYLAKK